MSFRFLLVRLLHNFGDFRCGIRHLSSLYNPTMVLRRSLQYSYLRKLLRLLRHYQCLMHSLQVPDVVFHVCLLHLRLDGSQWAMLESPQSALKLIFVLPEAPFLVVITITPLAAREP